MCCFRSRCQALKSRSRKTLRPSKASFNKRNPACLVRVRLAISSFLLESNPSLRRERLTTICHWTWCPMTKKRLIWEQFKRPRMRLYSLRIHHSSPRDYLSSKDKRKSTRQEQWIRIQLASKANARRKHWMLCTRAGGLPKCSIGTRLNQPPCLRRRFLSLQLLTRIFSAIKWPILSHRLL